MAKPPQRSEGGPVTGAVPPAPDESILESISDGVFTVDLEWRITSFNRAAEEITGIPRAQALGRRCSEVFRASLCEVECALRKTLETGRPRIDRPAFIVDASGRRIPISVSTAILRDRRGAVVGGAETFRDLSLVEELRQELSGRFQAGRMVSRSPLMRRLFDLLPALAASESTVLIQGETGTGKELLARAIHELSPRKARPFVPIDCGALPDPLLESELFGCKRGAFTGADRDRPGLIARAEKGTLFLDEIGEVSPALQLRLLRVLQERVYEPLGGRRPVRADVRVLAATHRDLAALVAEGAFRQDLFYRIQVVRLELPPLRRRREDIPLLVEHIVDRLSRIRDKQIEGASPQVLALLMAHDFPGNIRELENILEHASILCPGGMLEPAHLPEDFLARRPAPAPSGRLAETRRALEAQSIQDALRRNGGNRAAAARELGMHRATLHRKMRSLGIEGRRTRREP